MQVAKLLNSLMSKSLFRAVKEVLLMLELILAEEGDEFEEEWELVLEFTKNFIGAEGVGDSGVLDCFKRIFGSVKSIYVAGMYKGSVDELMNTYLVIKEELNDPLFDALYINYLIKNYDNTTLKGTLMNYVLAELSPIEEQDESNIRDFSRIMNILEALESVYLNTRHFEIQDTLEQLMLAGCASWAKFPARHKLRMAQFLQEIGLRTRSHDTVRKVLGTLLEITPKESDELLFIRTSIGPSKKETSVLSSDNQALGATVQSSLFKMFYRFYLDFPAHSLAHVLNAFLSSIREGDDRTKVGSLKMLGSLRYTADECVAVEQWRTASHLAVGKGKSKFDLQAVVDMAAKFLERETDPAMTSEVLKVLITIAKGHFILYEQDLNNLISVLFNLLEDTMETKEIAIPIGELLEVIVLQRGNEGNLKDINWLLLLFNNCLIQLEIVRKLLVNEIDEMQKKAGKKAQGAPHKPVQEIPPPQKPSSHLAEVVKALMRVISKAFYVERKELLKLMEKLIITLNQYVSNTVLVELVAAPIQEVISNLYYSDYLVLLPEANLVSLIDICLLMGWRSVIHSPDHSIPSLQDYLRESAQCSLSSLVAEEVAASSKAEGETAFSHLAFPDGGVGRKAAEEVESKLKVKKRKENAGEQLCFNYQHDDSHTMHTVTVNIVRLFLELTQKREEVDKMMILGYILRVAHCELKNTQSNIVQYSLALAELADWYCFSNLERAPNVVTSEGSKKLWALNDTLMTITTSSTEAHIDVRNVIGHSSFSVKLEGLISSPQYSYESAKRSLESFRRSAKAEEVKSVAREITPEYVLSRFPSSFYLRASEQLPGWKPIELTGKIEEEVKSLDDLPVYEKHSISVLYVTPDCTFTDDELYLVKEWSESFEKFLASLGALIRTSDYFFTSKSENDYSILWHDQFSQIVFNSNIFIARSAEPAIDKEKDIAKAREYLDNSNVWIVWNESGVEIPEKMLKDKRAAVFIIIVPLRDNYCQIQTFSVVIAVTRSGYVEKTCGASA